MLMRKAEQAEKERKEAKANEVYVFCIWNMYLL